jgi:hypothetical protein
MSEHSELVWAVSASSKLGRCVWIILVPLLLLEGLFALLKFVLSGALIRIIIEWINGRLREHLALQADTGVFWKIIDGRRTEGDRIREGGKLDDFAILPEREHGPVDFGKTIVSEPDEPR